MKKQALRHCATGRESGIAFVEFMLSMFVVITIVVFMFRWTKESEKHDVIIQLKDAITFFAPTEPIGQFTPSGTFNLLSAAQLTDISVRDLQIILNQVSATAMGNSKIVLSMMYITGDVTGPITPLSDRAVFSPSTATGCNFGCLSALVPVQQCVQGFARAASKPANALAWAISDESTGRVNSAGCYKAADSTPQITRSPVAPPGHSLGYS